MPAGHRSSRRPVAVGDAHVGLLEPRLLLVATNVPVVNPDFGIFYKPGSTSVTAVVPASDVTNGLGPGVTVATFGGGTPDVVPYSDGTRGQMVDIPGWVAQPAGSFKPPTQYVGVLGTATAPGTPPPQGTAAKALVVGNYPNGEQITQTLDVTLQPNTTYVLSVAADAEAADEASLPGVVIGLQTGESFLRPSASTTPQVSVTPNGAVLSGTYTRTYTTDANPPTGSVTIVLGEGPEVAAAGHSVSFSAVRLTADAQQASSPSATLSAPAVTAAGGTPETVTVTFTNTGPGLAGMDLSTIKPSNLTVTGPNGGTLAVTGVTTSPAMGTPESVTATYTIAAPAGGWSAADNGTYTVSLAGGQVTDAAENAVPATSTTFAVNVLPPGLKPGATDPTFAPATGGRVGVGFFAQASAVAPNGQILVAGQHPGSGGNTSQAVLQRLNADGSPDTTFGSGGMVVDSATSVEAFTGVLPLADGRVLVSGTSNGSLLLARYNPDGTPDPTFGSGGRVVTPVGGADDAVAYGLALDPASGNVVVGGAAGGQFLVARFTSSGAADPAFNGGRALLFGTAADGNALAKVAVLGTGRIVAVGAAAGGQVIAARLTAGGAVDTTFNAGGTSPGILVVNGLTTADLGTGVPDATEGLAVDASGNLLIANRTAAGDFGVARVTPNGTPDATFGTNGLATTDFGGTDDADEVIVQPGTGEIFVVGSSTSGGVTQTAVAALTPAGVLDTTFGDSGKRLIALDDEASPGIAASPAAAVAMPQSQIGGILKKMQRIVAALAGQGLVVGSSRQDPSAGTSASDLTRLVATGSASTGEPAGLPSGTLGVAVTGKLPASVVGGAKARAAVTVTVTNPSAQLVAGGVTVTLYVSSAPSLTGATQVLAATKSLKLKPGKSKAVKFRVGSFPSQPAGTYSLIATATGPDGTTTGAAGPSLSIAPAFVAVRVSNVQPLTASATPGKAARVSLVLTNDGNTVASGTANVTITAPASSGGTMTLATAPLKVKLKPGQSRTSKLKFTVPASLAAGSYPLTATLDVASLGDTDPTHGVANSTAPLIVG